MDAGYVYAGAVVDSHQIVDLGLRGRPVTISPGGSQMTLTASSDEALLQDWTPLGATAVYPIGTPVATVLAALVHWRVAPDAVVVSTLPASAVLTQALTVTTGANVWLLLADLADQFAAWLWVDGSRVWHLDPRPDLAGVSAHVMKTASGGTIEDLEQTLDRETWANAVLLTYAGGQQAWAWIETGSLSVTSVPVRVFQDRRDLPYPGADAAKAAARALVARTVSRGRGLTITAVAALWLRPGMTITVQPPDGPQERHLVSRVEFRFPAGTMTIRTRVPEGATTINTGA